METKYSIKNFRVFDNEGAKFDIAPITILTGCNSSGKSSMTKSLLVLNSYLASLAKSFGSKECIPQNIPLSFNANNARLGKFAIVKNNACSNEDSMEFSYRVKSKLLSEDITVTLNFNSLEDDVLDRGYLTSLLFSDEVGNNVLSMKFSQDKAFGFHLEYFDFNYFKKAFLNSSYCTSEQKEYGIINYLPILSKLSTLSKQDVKKELSSLMSNLGDDSPFKYCANKLSKEFQKSSFQYFIDFYKSFENQLDNQSYKGDVINFQNLEGIDIVYGLKDRLLPNYNFYNWTKHEKTVLEAACKDYSKNFPKDTDLDEYKLKFEAYIEGEKRKLWDRSKGRKSLSFSQIYLTLLNVSEISGATLIEDTILDIFGNKTEITPWYKAFQEYIINCIKEVLSSDLSRTVLYVNSDRAEVRRIYSPEETTDSFGALLLKYADCRRHNKNHAFEPGSFINEWFQKFEIGHSISIAYDDEGAGVKIIIYNSDKDKTGHLLADEGYGCTQLLSLLISIELCIMSAEETHYRNPRLNDIWAEMDKLYQTIDETGASIYIPEIGTYASQTIIVEEPEIHLHPKFQSMLAQIFFDAYRKYNIEFIVESHSEYLIRKLQLLVAGGMKHGHLYGLDTNEVSVYYMYNPNPNKRPVNEPQVKKMAFSDDGRFKTPFGKGFFDEADGLSMDLLTLKTQK